MALTPTRQCFGMDGKGDCFISVSSDPDCTYEACCGKICVTEASCDLCRSWNEEECYVYHKIHTLLHNRRQQKGVGS